MVQSTVATRVAFGSQLTAVCSVYDMLGYACTYGCLREASQSNFNIQGLQYCRVTCKLFIKVVVDIWHVQLGTSLSSRPVSHDRLDSSTSTCDDDHEPCHEPSMKRNMR